MFTSRIGISRSLVYYLHEHANLFGMIRLVNISYLHAGHVQYSDIFRLFKTISTMAEGGSTVSC